MAEIEGLTRREVGFQFGPKVFLTRIGKQILNHGSALGGFLEIKKGLARFPAVTYGQIIGL